MRTRFPQAYPINRIIITDINQFMGESAQDFEEILFGFRITPDYLDGFARIDFPESVRNV